LAIPVKAVIVNLLSVGASYGVIVAVFQWGWLGGFFGIGATGPIDPWIPLMMFTILFGLSMDYEVFLLSRIREEWRMSGDNSTAVADGLAKTARVITAAAGIMILVRLRRPAPRVEGLRSGPGIGHPDRRHPGPHGAGAVDHGAPRPGQLVDAPVARPGGAQPRCRGRRRCADRGRRGARPDARRLTGARPGAAGMLAAAFAGGARRPRPESAQRPERAAIPASDAR